MDNFRLNTIEEALEDFRNGEFVIVVDDEDRENEGDFLTAARNASTEVVNFMATHGRGLICAPLSEERCDELGLELMVRNNSAAYETPFTVSIEGKALFFSINGVLYQYGTDKDFHTDGTKLYWHGSFNLETTDVILVKYLQII